MDSVSPAAVRMSRSLRLMYLKEHFLEVILWTDPGRNGITEEDEILNDTVRIDVYHRTDAAE